MTRRMWPAHAIGLALLFAGFAFGCAYYAAWFRLPFGSALHGSLVFPLFVGMTLFPVSFVAGAFCIVLFFAGYERRSRGFLVGGYALLAVYWAALAVFSANLDL